jgi:malate dehydrogenase (quinone)
MRCLQLLRASIFLLSLVSPSLLRGASDEDAPEVDVVLIGAGVMSATLGSLLSEIDPSLKIEVFERLPSIAGESSDTLNNAGTGHAALCELNYTPLKPDGSVDISKAIAINEDFEVSKQFWAHLARKGALKPDTFIHSIPHMSWVRGAENVDYLRKRHEALSQIPLFAGMDFSEKPEELRSWLPLMMKGRADSEPMAATRSLQGTDIDFGKLTESLFAHLSSKQHSNVHTAHEVRDIRQRHDNLWQLEIKDLRSGEIKRVRSKFLFIGAGGGTLPLLQASGVEEAKGYGGFPVSGEFLVYKGTELSSQHFAKVYGQAAVGAPPMSVPHLDTRIIDGKKTLIFGPFAGATTKFLKKGSIWDLFGSLRPSNLRAMIKAGLQNLGLIGYLADQQVQSHSDRMEALREFIPEANPEEWELVTAGQRVQIIKEVPGKDSVLQFGTEVVTSKDGSLAALLGASPGASTSVSIMLEIIERSFAEKLQDLAWRAKIATIIPSYGVELSKNAELTRKIRATTNKALGLHCEDSLI